MGKLQLRRDTDSVRGGITPADGEPFFTTDTKRLYVGMTSVWYPIPRVIELRYMVESPTVGDRIPLRIVNDFTIDTVIFGQEGATDVTLNLTQEATLGGGKTDIITADQTVTAETTVTSGFNDATVPAGSYVDLDFSAQTGTATRILVTIRGTED